jgi:hypothetical protein
MRGELLDDTVRDGLAHRNLGDDGALAYMGDSDDYSHAKLVAKAPARAARVTLVRSQAQTPSGRFAVLP